MNTGMNFRPLCTAKVKPTMSGVMVERRDQVFTTFFSPDSSIARTFFARCVSTNGPFLTERAIRSLLAHLPSLPEPADAAGLAVGDVLVLEVADLPDGGAAGEAHAAELARGELEQRVVALLRHQLDGRARAAAELAAAALAQLDVVDHGAEGDERERQAVAGFDVGLRPRLDRVADGEPDGRQDVALLAVEVVQEGDARGAVRVVLDGGHPGRHAQLVALEVDQPVEALVAPAAVAEGHAAEVVPPARLAQRRGQGALGPGLGDLGEVGAGLEPAAGRGRAVLDGRHPLRSLEEVDPAALGQRDVGLLPVGAAPLVPADATDLPELAARPHLFDLHLHVRQVARRALDGRVRPGEDEEHARSLEAEATQALDHALGLRLGQAEVVHHQQGPRRVPARDRGAEGRPARRPGQTMGPVAGLRPEDGAAARPQRRADAARTRAAGALLPPGLLAAAAHQPLRLGRRRARAPRRELALHGGVQEVLAHRARDHRGGHLDLAHGGTALRDHRKRHRALGHGYFRASRPLRTTTVPF